MTKDIVKKQEKVLVIDLTLPICLQKDFNFNLGYAFPLCVLLGDPNYLGWYYENYIEHFFFVSKEKFLSSGIFDALEY